jgi:hypothetical protein
MMDDLGGCEWASLGCWARQHSNIFYPGGRIYSKVAMCEAEIRRIIVWGQPGQKMLATFSQTISWSQWCMPIIPVSGRHKLKDHSLKPAQAKVWAPIWKINKTTGAGGAASLLILPWEILSFLRDTFKWRRCYYVLTDELICCIWV